MQFHHLSSSVRDLSQKTFTKKFVTLGKVLSYWEEIVGPDLSARTTPLGMSLRKNPPRPGERPATTGTLEIGASGADATLIHYQKDLILERLALALGSAMVTDLKVVHYQAAGIPAAPSLPTGLRPPALSPAQQQALSADIAAIEDPSLREALRHLGEKILSAPPRGGRKPQ